MSGLLSAREVMLVLIGPSACRPLLEASRRVHGTFKVTHPERQTLAGRIRVTVEWAHVLQPVQAPPPTAPAGSQPATLAPLGEAGEQLDPQQTLLEICVLGLAISVRLWLSILVAQRKGKGTALVVQGDLLQPCQHRQRYCNLAAIALPHGWLACRS